MEEHETVAEESRYNERKALRTTETQRDSELSVADR